MISEKRLVDTSGKQFIHVESRVPDGNVPHATGSCILSCTARGIDDGDARSKAIKFAIATDLLPPFRTFIFTEVDPTLPAAAGRTEGQALPSFPPRSDAHSAVGSSQENTKRRVRSFVCKRQSRLQGLGFVVAMARLESGRFRAISFQDHSSGGGSMSDEVRNKAVRFLRGVAFEKWRKQAANELSGREREPAGYRKERALKHVNAFVEIEAGEKVDCACGKNRSRGLMVACERCGAWEHAECQGYRSDKQIPTDYICSACMRAEWEEVVVINLDEQESFGKWRLEDVWTDARARDGDVDTCLVCGCEDNEDFENMISPESEHVCEGGGALAHPSCISAAQHAWHKISNGKVMPAGMCQFCGERFAKSPKGNDEVLSHMSSGVSRTKSSKGSLSPNHPQGRSSRRTAKTDQTGRAAKRLRSALTNGAVVAKQEIDKRPSKSIKDEESDLVSHEAGEKMDLASPESAKVCAQQVGTAPPDRRFSDPAVTVPIKKRRLMMMEVVRSPSPPPRSPSPSPQMEDVSEPEAKPADHKNGGDVQIEVVHASEDAEMVEVGSSEQASPDGVPRNVNASSGNLGYSRKDQNRMEEPEIRFSASNSKILEGGDGPHAHGSEAAPAHQENHIAAVDEENSVERGTVDLMAGSNADEKRTFESEQSDEKMEKSADVEEGNGLHDPENKDAGTTTSSASQSRSRDVRLHWDLNMDMEEWERPPEEDTGTFPGLQGDSWPLPSSPAHEMTIGSRDLKEGPDQRSDHASPVHSESEPVLEVLQARESEGEAILEKEKPQAESEGGADTSSDAASVESKHQVDMEVLNTATKGSSVEEDYSDLLEAEHVDYDGSDSRNGDDGGSDAEERVESEWRNSEEARSEKANRRREYVSDVDMNAEQVNEGAGEDEDGASKLGDHAERPVRVEGREHLEASTAFSECSVRLKGIVAQQPNFELSDKETVVWPEYQEVSDVHSNEEAVEEISNKKAKSVLLRGEKRVQEETEASVPGSSGRRAEGQSRAKSSGWDQLPEGFDKAEDALRAAKENPAIRGGRVSPWATANGRGTSMSPRGGPTSTRFGRGLRVDGVGDRARSEDSWNREDHQRTHRVDDSVDLSPGIAPSREFGRGRSHGRGGSHVARSRGRMEPWMDSPSSVSSPWGPNRHPSPPGNYSDGFGPRGATNAATRALLKVESSGFVVAPDGTITKAGTPTRGPPRPFQSGRSGRVGMLNMGRGGGPGMGMGGVGTNLGGSLRMNMGGMGGRGGMGVGPGMGVMNMGLGPGMGIGGVGPGVGLGMRQGAPGGRGTSDRYNGAYSGRGAGGPDVEHSSALRRGRSNDDYNERWSREEEERSVSPRRRSTSRRSPSGSPSTSKSRTRSPRTRTPPRPTNSSGSAGGSLGKSSKKHSHSPGTQKSDARGDRDSPPARRAIPPPPKLPLPPPPPRSQRSPPAGLKRLSESKRDVGRARSRDRDREQRERERERQATRATRSPPKRTSPHVVHGSALMDERDRQLLAVIRHVSPLSARSNRSSEAAGAAGAVTSSRESPSLASPGGRTGEGAGEVRRHSGDDVENSRGLHGPRKEEVGFKAEHRGSKETSRTNDRERNARRDSGRDRQEERKDGFGRDRNEERRDLSKLTYSARDRDGRSGSNLKYSREGDDDVAPRRRRPSP